MRRMEPATVTPKSANDVQSINDISGCGSGRHRALGSRAYLITSLQNIPSRKDLKPPPAVAALQYKTLAALRSARPSKY